MNQPDVFGVASSVAKCLARFKGLQLNTDKTKVMIFFSKDTSATPTFQYNGTPLELVTEFKYLGFTLTRNGKMHTAVAKMSDTFRGAIARVFKTGDSKGIKHRKHALMACCCGFSRYSL